MIDPIRTYTITIGKVFNGEEECTSPHVELAGKQDIAVNCIDPEGCVYTVQLGPNDDEPCLIFLVTCEDCDVCGTKVIRKCFCDSIDDCGDCEICDSEGFCTSVCTDICEDGTCIECNTEHPCTCNQVCQNGTCKCPPGSVLNANGCCDECDKDSDCNTCEVCVEHEGYSSCDATDCHCDASGRCGEEGACVECLSSGHCLPHEVCDNNCECVCAPGYKRVNGVCVPTECPNGDSDCAVCEICSGEVCVPIQCPAGRVPAVVNGVCACVQECNCAQPDCSSKFNYCGESSIPGKCACLPCEGTCDTGCEDPCICDEDLNKCKFNPCFGSCETGLDCGPTCGCDNGTCVPCDSLDCAEDDCSRALGCECSAAQKCVKDGGCDESPCSVASDCDFGCTCDDGICQSCSNFSCETSDCSNQDGCACNAGNCEGDTDECNDEVTLEKNDDSCELTGTLVKQTCCQCPAMTLDVKVTTAADVAGGQKRVKFTAEVRKGAYDGVSVDSTPLVDDFTNESIAENEPPLSGTIKLQTVINYTVYDIVGGKDVYKGTSTSDGTPVKKVYDTGDVSQKEFQVDFPKIGTRTTSGLEASVVTSIDVRFTLDTTMSFDNDCQYSAGTEIGVFKITSNDGFIQTPIASTIKSGDCRKPFFKWARFAAGSATGDVFKKEYVDETSANLWSQTITGPDDAQSCYTYVFEPDCNCDDPVSKYIVFCNPSDFDKPVLTNCNRTYNFVIPSTCSANYTKYYELLINGVAVTVSGGKKFLLTSDKTASGTHPEPITSIVLHMVCDTQGECDIEFEYDERAINPTPIGVCQPDGTVDFTFPTLSTGILSVTFDGETKTSAPFTFTDREPNTDYTFSVIYTDGCISDEETTSKEDCCNDPEITCLSTGKYQVTSTSGFAGMTYNGLPIPTSGIINPPVTGTATLTYTCGGTSKTITVYPYSTNSECCKIIPRVSHEGTSVVVEIDSASTGGPFTVVVGTQSATVAAGASHTFLNVPTGAVSLTITSTTNSNCKYTETLNVSDCNLGLEIELDSDNCTLVATTDNKACDCPNGKISGSVGPVSTIPGNKISVTYLVTPAIEDSTDVGIVSSTLKIYENGGSTAVVVKNLTTLNPYTSTSTFNTKCVSSSTSIPYDAKIEVCEAGCGSQTHALTVYVASPYTLTSVKSGTTTYSVGSNSAGEYYAYISPSNIASTLTLTFSNGSTTYTTLQSFNTVVTQYAFPVSTSTCGTCVDLKLVYETVLQDGCSYKGELFKTICAGETSAIPAVNLTKIDAVRDMEFVLYEDDVQIRRDFEEDFEMVYTTEQVEFQPESEYKVVAICGCEEEEQTTDCFDATITLAEEPSNCNRHFVIDIESCYIGVSGTAYLGTSSSGFTIDPDGQAQVTFDLFTPLLTENISVVVEYDGGLCSQTEVVGTTVQPQFVVEYNCQNPGVDPEFDAEITATIDGDNVTVTILGIPSGTGGTISGTSIEGITTTTLFYATVKVNDIAGCTYNVPIQSNCDCNITSAFVTPSVNACVVNGVGSVIIQLSTTRTNTAAAWKAVTSGGTNLVTTSTSTGNVSATISNATLTTLAPLVGSNTVTVYFKDVASGDTCKTETFIINKTVLNYTIEVNDCVSNFWSVDIDGLTAGATVGSLSSGSGSISGTSVINIPDTKASISFTLTKGTCSKVVTANRPVDCHECNSSNISFGSVTLAAAPCDDTDTSAQVRVVVSSSDGSCPISSVTVGGISASNSGSYWLAILDPASTGNKTIIATDACGCTKQHPTGVQVNQDCCGAASAVSISIPDAGSMSLPYPDICVGETLTAIVSNLPAGYTATWSTANVVGGSASFTLGGTTTNRTITLNSVGGSPTSAQYAVVIKNSGGTTCTTLYPYIAITSCPDDDVCTGYTGCNPCQTCYDAGGAPACEGDLSTNGDACTGGTCCNGTCTPSGDLCVADELCSAGCGYTSCSGCTTEICNACYAVANLGTGTAECFGGDCTIFTGFSISRNNDACTDLSLNAIDYTMTLSSYSTNPEFEITSIAGSASGVNVFGRFNLSDIGVCPGVLQVTIEHGSCITRTQTINFNSCVDSCAPCFT